MQTELMSQRIQLSNASPEPMIVFLEPWAEELTLPTHSTLTLDCTGPSAIDILPDIDVTDGLFTVWGHCGSRISVLIDGVDQECFSGRYPAPDFGVLTSKNFVNLVFGNQPTARPVGLPLKGTVLSSDLRQALRRVSGSILSNIRKKFCN